MKNRKNIRVRRLISILVVLIGLVLVCYIGGWLLFIKPILYSWLEFQ